MADGAGVPSVASCDVSALIIKDGSLLLGKLLKRFGVALLFYGQVVDHRCYLVELLGVVGEQRSLTLYSLE